jgi:hypothetical protein
MARKENSLDSVELRTSTNPVLKAQLEQLVLTGRYGKNWTEAAERLIAEAIGKLIDEGKLKAS